MKEKKLKISGKQFRRRLIPALAVILVLTIILNIGCMIFSTTLDTFLGRGISLIVGGDDTQDSMYYNQLYADRAESTAAAYETARRIAEEGSVLLKNNGVLPLEKGSIIMPFGNAYLNPIYGQLTSAGSAKWVKNPITPEQGLEKFTIVNTAVERMNAAGDACALEEADGTTVAGEGSTILGGDCKIYEYDPAIYTDISPVDNTTGIVFITRSGQEGQDQKHDAYEDGTPHYLALSEYEKGTIAEAKRVCGDVIVILVSSAAMELAPLMSGELEVSAILWVAHPGERGFEVLSALLSGEVKK